MDPSLSQVAIRSTSQHRLDSAASQEHLVDIWFDAIRKYQHDTGIELRDPAVAAFDSAEKIVEYIQENEQSFSRFRMSGYKRLRERIEPIAAVVSTLCDCLGEAVTLPYSPVKSIFAAFKVAIQVAMKLKADYDAIVDAFDTMKFHLEFIEPITGSRYYEKLRGPTVELLAHILVVLGVVTKVQRDRRFKGFFKKLCGNKDVATAMAKLQVLALKQHRAMSAMTLQGVERNTTMLEGGFTATSREQEAQKMQLMQLQCQMYELAHPAMFTAVHYTQIDVGVLEDMQRLVLQSQEDLTQRLVSEIELRSLVRIGWRLIVSSYLNTRVRRTSRWFLDGLPFSSLKRGQIQLLALYGPVQSGMETILSAAMADLSASCASPGHRCVIVFRFECEEQPRRPQYLVFPLLYQLLSYFDTPPTWFDTSRLEAKLSQDEIMDFLHHLIDDLAPRRIYIIVAGSNIQHVDILYELLSRHSNVSALISLNSTTPCPIPPGLSSTVLPMCTDLIRREMDVMLNNVVMPGNTLAQIKDTMVVQRTLDRYRGNFPDVRQFEIDVIWIAKLAKTPIEVLQWLDMLVDNVRETGFPSRVDFLSKDRRRDRYRLAWLIFTRPSKAAFTELLSFDYSEWMPRYDPSLRWSSLASSSEGSALSFLDASSDKVYEAVVDYLQHSEDLRRFFYQNGAYYIIARMCLTYFSAVGVSRIPNPAKDIQHPLYCRAKELWTDYANAAGLHRYPDLRQHIIDFLDTNDGRYLMCQGSCTLQLLHRNVIRDNLDIVHLLIDCGADTNFVDEMVYTPLHCAALMPRAYRQNRESIARLLLIRGANPNATNPRGQTPLHIAAEEGYAKCIRLLLDHGADPNVCDSYGETPLDLFLKSGVWQCDDPDIEELLRKAMGERVVPLGDECGGGTITEDDGAQ